MQSQSYICIYSYLYPRFFVMGSSLPLSRSSEATSANQCVECVAIVVGIIIIKKINKWLNHTLSSESTLNVHTNVCHTYTRCVVKQSLMGVFKTCINKSLSILKLFHNSSQSLLHTVIVNTWPRSSRSSRCRTWTDRALGSTAAHD